MFCCLLVVCLVAGGLVALFDVFYGRVGFLVGGCLCLFVVGDALNTMMV